MYMDILQFLYEADDHSPPKIHEIFLCLKWYYDNFIIILGWYTLHHSLIY